MESPRLRKSYLVINQYKHRKYLTFYLCNACIDLASSGNADIILHRIDLKRLKKMPLNTL